MKYLHIERLSVRVKTLSPLFIGGGAESSLNKKNSVCLRDRPVLLVPRQETLVEALDYLGLSDAYERFLTGPAADSLADFLARNNVSAAPSSPWVAYALECSEERINSLKLFIKQPDGRPYLPGSSVKGAFRTAMLAARMTAQAEQALLNDAEMNPKRRRQGKEEALLRTLRNNQRNAEDAVNDLFKGLAVSDSAPLAQNVLVVTRKRDHKAGACGTEESRMPLLRECIRPGVTVPLTLSLDTTVFSAARLDELKKALDAWDARLRERYLRQFDVHLADMPVEDGFFPIRLGGGAGFQTKSLLYAARDPERVRGLVHGVLNAQFYNRFKRKGTYPALPGSPKPAPTCLKLTDYRGSCYSYGRCSLGFDG